MESNGEKIIILRKNKRNEKVKNLNKFFVRLPSGQNGETFVYPGEFTFFKFGNDVRTKKHQIENMSIRQTVENQNQPEFRLGGTYI